MLSLKRYAKFISINKFFKMKRLIFLSVISCISFFLQAQTADDLLQKYYKTVGAEKWKATKTMKMLGEAGQMGMSFPITLYTARPNKRKVVIDIQGQTLIDCFDGTTAWSINPFMGGTTATKKTEEENKEAAKEKFEDELIDYAAKGHKVELLDKEEIGGVQAIKLKLTKKDGDEVFYFFDPENNVPIMVRSFASAGQMKGQPVETYMSDYQEVGGITFPFSLETKMDGQTMFTVSIKSAELDVEIKDEDFAFPAK